MLRGRLARHAPYTTICNQRIIVQLPGAARQDVAMPDTVLTAARSEARVAAAEDDERRRAVGRRPRTILDHEPVLALERRPARRHAQQARVAARVAGREVVRPRPREAAARTTVIEPRRGLAARLGDRGHCQAAEQPHHGAMSLGVMVGSAIRRRRARGSLLSICAIDAARLLRPRAARVRFCVQSRTEPKRCGDLSKKSSLKSAAFIGIDAFWRSVGVLSQLQKRGSDCDA